MNICKKKQTTIIGDDYFMKDTIGQFGWVILGIAIVAFIILGLMLNTSEQQGEIVDTRLDTHENLLESSDITLTP